MEYNYDRAEEKKNEIIGMLSSQLKSLGLSATECKDLANVMTSISIKVSPPEAEELRMEFVTLTASGRGGGKSTKPGNVRLNIRALIESIANCTLASATVAQIPLMAPLAFILLWNSMWRAVQVDLSENDAATIYAMWVHRDRKYNTIEQDGLLNKVNAHLLKYGRANMTQQDLDFSIKRLEYIETIKKIDEKPASWKLCESIQPMYR